MDKHGKPSEKESEFLKKLIRKIGSKPFQMRLPPLPRVIQGRIITHSVGTRTIQEARKNIYQIISALKEDCKDLICTSRSRSEEMPIDRMEKLLESGKTKELNAVQDSILRAVATAGKTEYMLPIISITTPGRIVKIEKLRLVPKGPAFIDKRALAGDCTRPGGTAFYTFTIPALLSNAHASYEIIATTTENNPKAPGKIMLQRHKPVGLMSIMYGSYEGEPAMYVHNIQLNPQYGRDSNAYSVGFRITTLLKKISEATGVKHILLDPIQISNHELLRAQIYEMANKMGAQRADSNGFTPHDDPENILRDLEFYGSPWKYQRTSGHMPIHIPIKKINKHRL